MEILNSIGFANFWGVTPFANLFETESAILSQSSPVNILLSNSNDLRHILYTIYKLFVLKKEENKQFPEINFYIHEDKRENLCRDILFIHLITDRTKSIIERCEMLMEIYGNVLLPSRTIDYINAVYRTLIMLITNNPKCNVVYKSMLDFTGLTSKEIDEMVDILTSYDSKYPYDIEKYRNDRVRYALKDRYDYRNNLFDWDYHMNLIKYAPIIRSQHYLYWRNYGIAFEMRLNRYKFPNRTLACYIQGRRKDNKGSCMVRGFWGDIVNSPYIGYGLELETRDEIAFFYANNKIQYLRDSQDVTEYNLIKILLRLDHDGKYDFMKREQAKEKKRKERIRQQQEEEARKQKQQSNENNQLNPIKEEEEEMIDTSSTPSSTPSSKAVKIDKEDNTIEKITQKVMESTLNNTEAATTQSKTTEEEMVEIEGDDASLYDPNELIQGFRELNVKLHFLSGSIDKLFRKKKFNNFFDIILYGFHASSKFDLTQKNVLKPNTRILFELNSHMASFNEKQREEYIAKIKELGQKNNLILDDTTLKYLYQFKYKEQQKEKDNE